MTDLLDLSHRHEPVSSLYDTSDPEVFRLPTDAVSSFERDGFLTGVPALEPIQIQALLDELEPLLDPAHPSSHLFYERHLNESCDPDHVLFHALGAWRISPAFHDLLWNPAITVPASQLLGGNVRFWHDQLFVKPAHHGGAVAWHQDYSYWTRTEPMAHVTCWIPLDDVDEENGCLQYVSGSHRWRLLPITGLLSGMDAIDSVLTEDERREFAPTPVVLRRGQASFHHPLTVHGSFANRSRRRRRAIALNFCADGTRSATDQPLFEGVPVIPRGQPLGGRFFPLLYSGTRFSVNPSATSLG